MTQVLYNLRTSDLGYRITKFADGEVESSYLTSDQACDCPAGHRATCRHRQMLPDLLPIANSQWFWDFDRHMVVDLMGISKATIDALIALIKEDLNMTAACPPGCCAPAEQDTERRTFTIPDGHMAERDADGRATGKVVPAGQHTAAESLPSGVEMLTLDGDPSKLWNAIADAVGEPRMPTKPWRRL